MFLCREGHFWVIFDPNWGLFGPHGSRGPQEASWGVQTPLLGGYPQKGLFRPFFGLSHKTPQKWILPLSHKTPQNALKWAIFGLFWPILAIFGGIWGPKTDENRGFRPQIHRKSVNSVKSVKLQKIGEILQFAKCEFNPVTEMRVF